MSEFQMFMNMTNGNVKFKTSIIKYPSGLFGFVGDIPDSLGEWKKNKIGQDFFASKVYQTREEAEKALAEVK